MRLLARRRPLRRVRGSVASLVVAASLPWGCGTRSASQAVSHAGAGAGGAAGASGASPGAGSAATSGASGSAGSAGAPSANAGSAGLPSGGASGAGAGNAAGSGQSGSTGAGGSPGAAGTGGASALGGMAGAPAGGASAGRAIRYAIVIPLENHDAGEIVGNAADAPYINQTLLTAYASASNFVDTLPLNIPSEPHYVWMEAGTNQFADHTFTSDDLPSASNSTADTDHLVTRLAAASPPVSWKSYQEGLDATTGACPITASGSYVPRHDPFVFFRDVAGDPPSKSSSLCAEHHAPLDAFWSDLTAETVPRYAFVTPNLCHDMHGQSGCPDKNLVHSGDAWLEANLPPVIAFVTSHAGVVFLVWDEGESTTTLPFVAIGPGVKRGYVSPVRYTHGSLVKSLAEIFGVPSSSRVAAENDFSDLFEAGSFP